MSDLRTPTEAADYLRVPVETMRQWRYRGTGPSYAKVGRHVRYRQAALDQWLQEREQEASSRAG